MIWTLISRWAVVDYMEGKAINLIWYPFWQSGLLSHSIDAKSSNDGFADDDNDDNAEESHQEISQYFWLRLICQFYDNSLLDSRLLFLITQPPIMRHVIVQCQRDHCHLHHVPQSHCYKKQHNSFSYPSPLYIVQVSTGSSSPSSLAACSLGRSRLAVKCRHCYPFSPSHGLRSRSCSRGLEGYQNSRYIAHWNLCLTLLFCNKWWDTKTVSNMHTRVWE